MLTALRCNRSTWEGAWDPALSEEALNNECVVQWFLKWI